MQHESKAAPLPEAEAEPAAKVAAKAEGLTQPLGEYLREASVLVAYRVYPRQKDNAWDLQEKEYWRLGASDLQTYLKSLDLTQVGSALPRCLAEEGYRFLGADGQRLGALSFCDQGARFDAPDGSSAGVMATKLDKLQGLKSLGDHLAGAEEIVVYGLSRGGEGRGELKSVEKARLDRAATQAYLASQDLAQIAGGDGAACLQVLRYAFLDAAGEELAQLRFCGAMATLSTADGGRGSVTVSKIELPPAQ